MGLLSGLLTLPLAPVNGVVWVARRLVDYAEREVFGEEAIRGALEDLDAEHAAGRISEAERDEAERQLMARLASRRQPGER
jgi:hypothetical protein